MNDPASPPTTAMPALMWLKQRHSLVAAMLMLGLTFVLAVLLLVLDVIHEREKAGRATAHLARLDAEEDVRLAQIALDLAVTAALEGEEYQAPELATARRDLLEQARVCYARLAARDGTGRAARRHAAIVADVAGRELAIPLYENALVPLIAALEVNPEDAAARHELARGWIGLGDACLWAGSRVRAIEAFQSAISVAAEVRDCRGERARALLGLGAALTPARGANPGEVQEAETALTTAIGILEQLVAESPGRSAWARGPGRCWRQRGHLMWATGRSAEAETAFRRALAGQEELIARRPLAPAFRDSLAALHHDLGDLLLDGGRIEEGRAALRQAADIAGQLARDHPGSAAHRRGWAAALLNLALAHRTGRLEDEEPPLRAALRLWHEMRGGAPPTECFLNESWTHWRLGDALRRRGKSAGALVEFRYALHAAEEGLKQPEDSFQFSLRLTRLAALADLGDPGRALAEVQALTTGAAPRELFALAATCAVASERGGDSFALPAIDLLRRAGQADPRLLGAAAADHDFDPIRKRPEFQALVGRP